MATIVNPVKRQRSKPRGSLWPLGRAYHRRLSLCCGRRGCRKRVTPPSVRHLGRKVYLAAVIVLCTAMQHGVTPQRAAALQQAVGVSRQTLRRWRAFWQRQFVQTPLWQAVCSRFLPPVEPERLPQSLLERFGGELGTQRSLLLRFLAPLQTNSTGGGQ